ncbi:diaminopimelate epimerase [Gracilimonas sp. Q87]|uniref:diaminopimelate epimerase n=1 Tax=Gracilimonas sp. Q87 TaxID=3384766 RepID=UPI003983E4C2
MHKISFHKMEGAGNDFVVIDNRNYSLTLEDIIQFTPKLCDRKFGIGADGILVLQPPLRDDVDYTMIYRNADGSDAGMCGNGARCLSMFAFYFGFGSSQTFNVHDNVYESEIHSDDSVSIHFPVHVQIEEVKVDELSFIKADAGTEHLIHFVEKEHLDNDEDLIETGRKTRYHESIDPPGTNVNFVHCDDSKQISLQTYERGVENLTLACGTGALASAIAAHHRQGKSEKHSEFDIHVRGGRLKASFDFDPNAATYHQLILSGPANFVFKGSITV